MKHVLAFVLILASSVAFADDARKIDFTAHILDQNGVAAHVSDDKSPILTLGDVVAAALYRAPPSDPRAPQSADPIQLAKRAILAGRLYHATDATLTAEEVVQIKGSIGFLPPLVVLRVIEAIDPASLK
jgi:hypothetical protein